MGGTFGKGASAQSSLYDQFQGFTPILDGFKSPGNGQLFHGTFDPFKPQQSFGFGGTAAPPAQPMTAAQGKPLRNQALMDIANRFPGVNRGGAPSAPAPQYGAGASVSQMADMEKGLAPWGGHTTAPTQGALTSGQKSPKK